MAIRNVETRTKRAVSLPARFAIRSSFRHKPSIFWSAFGQLPVLTRMMPAWIIGLAHEPHGSRPKPREADMDEIVCANTAFRYWRCPPQVRDLYPRLPNSEDGWRALSQSPFVVDVLKTPVITVASTRSNLHSDTRRTIRWDEAYKGNVSCDTDMGFSVTDPLYTLFTMTRCVSQSDLVMAMYEFCGWFSVFKPSAAVDLALEQANTTEPRSSTDKLFELDETQEEAPWKRVYTRMNQNNAEENQGERANSEFEDNDKGRGTSIWMRKPLIEIEELRRFARKVKSEMWGRQFYDAAQQVIGVAASPLEVAGSCC